MSSLPTNVTRVQSSPESETVMSMGDPQLSGG
jgi:hypothetical protein